MPVQHGPTTSIYYCDPDGNMVELQIDNLAPPEWVEAVLLAAHVVGSFFAVIRTRRDARRSPSGYPGESQLTTRAWALTCPQRNVPELLLT